MIQAIKNAGEKNQQTKQFSEEVWKLMGKEKNGWVKVSDSIAKNEVTKKSQPETGDKGKVTLQIVETDAEIAARIDKEEAAKENITKKAPVEPTEDEKLKKAFFALVQDNLTKNVIKNYLDDDAVNVSYKENTMNGLTEVLYTHFNGDVAALQSSKLFTK